jgi:predicted nuclease of predicted toxin-antitoxin system
VPDAKVARFLLDESVSEQIAIHLRSSHGLDVMPFHQFAKYGTDDSEIRELALQLDRVIITRDSDFAVFSGPIEPTPPGVIWIHPPRSLRTLTGEKRLLDRFFVTEASTYDLENSIIEIKAFTARLIYSAT